MDVRFGNYYLHKKENCFQFKLLSNFILIINLNHRMEDIIAKIPIPFALMQPHTIVYPPSYLIGDRIFPALTLPLYISTPGRLVYITHY